MEYIFVLQKTVFWLCRQHRSPTLQCDRWSRIPYFDSKLPENAVFNSLTAGISSGENVAFQRWWLCPLCVCICRKLDGSSCWPMQFISWPITFCRLGLQKQQRHSTETALYNVLLWWLNILPA